MKDGSYYTKGLEVWRHPKHTPEPDGSAVTITMGFQVCTATDLVGEDGAKAIAESLNKTHAE